MEKELIEKALSMRRDYTMTEIAQMLGVRQEELFEAVRSYQESDKPMPEAIPPDSGPPHPKLRGKKKTERAG